MLAIRLGLRQYLEPEHSLTIGRSLFLFLDKSELFTVLSDNKAGGRPEDIPTTDLKELLALLGYIDSADIE